MAPEEALEESARPSAMTGDGTSSEMSRVEPGTSGGLSHLR